MNDVGVPEPVIDRVKMKNDLDTKVTAETLSLMRQAMKLVATMSGNNKTAAMIDKKLRIASPRLLSVVPEDEEKGVSDLYFVVTAE